MGGNESTPEKNYHFKYSPTGAPHYADRLEAALIGTCIRADQLRGSAKARSGSRGVNDNLGGIIHDGANVYRYLMDNGANIHTYEFTVPAVPGRDVKEKVFRFLSGSGNNKLLYMTGHGDEDGDLVLGSNVYLSAMEVFGCLGRSNFTGLITIAIDACYSGMWAKILKRAIINGRMDGDHSDPAIRGLEKAAQACGRKLYINLRLSSLCSETSRDTGGARGGRFTDGILQVLRREHAWTKQEGNGWGTKVWLERKIDGKDALWTVKTSEPQTDLPVDFVYYPETRRWKWFYPASREKYF